jgi:peroxiredoxin
MTSTHLNEFGAGDLAPDVQLVDHEGNRVALSTCWRQRPTAFVFVRHFGCPYCRLQLIDLNKRYAEIVERGGQVVAIAMGDVARTAQFRGRMAVRFPMLADESESAYDAYGLIVRDHTVGEVLTNVSMAVSLVARGQYGPVFEGGNRSRMGGSFTIGTDGRVLYAHRDQNSGGRAPVEEIVASFDLVSVDGQRLAA